MKKRGQLLGQPIILIFALVVGALILIFGIRAVLNLQSIGGEVVVSKFVNNLRNEVEQYSYLDYGSNENIKLNLPKKVNHICFKNETGSWNPSMSLKEDEEKFIKTFDKNMFILPTHAYKIAAFQVENLRIKGNKNPLCFRNREEITITSKGTYVEISG